ncbi:hypothetical protein tinsulaeT_38370 [Thalassotalea insulae]|uniref:Uncharacterized protein n=1 Tax=Thalassotalea insulae TaxID=2056778 RepID=A0ABQ6GYV0_9GAMM|nr:hypothetical protein tinsulaeT_38370 [Thalassotalea insulae]
MDNYSLADILIKSIVIMLGCYFVMRGKQLKTSNNKQEATMLPPNTMIILGMVIIISNGYLLLDNFL